MTRLRALPRDARSFVLPWLVAAAAAACGTPPAPSAPSAPAEPVLDATGRCGTLSGYEVHAASSAPALDWSAVHGTVRYFGDHEDPFQIDEALVRALDGATGGDVPHDRAAWTGYAEAVGGCRVSAWPLPDADLPAPTSELAWARPGEPRELGTARALLVDLRAVPEGATLTDFPEAHASRAIHTPVPPLSAELREHVGMRDEAYSPLLLGAEGLYDDAISQRALPGIAAGAPLDLHLGFVVGPHLAPSAARFVLTLRAEGRAAVLGDEIDVESAEAWMLPVDDGGLAVRTMRLFHGSEALPDHVAPDALGTSYDALGAAFLALGPLAAPTGPARRSALRPLPNRTAVAAHETHEAARIAALLTAHAASRRFFPYFDVVPDTLDARLEGALALPREQRDDLSMLRASIGYFSSALHDSHGFVWDTLQRTGGAGGYVLLPIALDTTEQGEPIVRRSSSSLFARGDVILGVDDVDATTVVNHYLEYVASSDSSRERNGLAALQALRAGQRARVRAPDGVERTITVPAQGGAVPDVIPRRVEWLSPTSDVLYVNLDGDHFGSAELAQVRAQLPRARALLLDMRGYPGEQSWALVPDLLPEGSPGVSMELVHVWLTGSERAASPQPWEPTAGAYAGPIVILVGPTTQSSAEHLTLTLQAARRVHVMGRPTAGANGNITGIALAGDIALTFTGMRVLQADGSRFHGVGCLPDTRLPVTVEALVASEDPELDRALEHLQ